MGTWQFWLLWVMLFLNVSAGIMIISQASPMAQQMVGMTAVAAAGMVGLISIFNGLGRVFWAWVSDHIGRARVYLLLYLIQVVIFFSLPRIHNLTAFSIAFAIIGLCYGGGFGTMPSFTADFFGPKFMGGIYGMDSAGLGRGRDPVTHPDRAPAPGDRQVRYLDLRGRGRAGVLAGVAADRQAPADQGRGAAQSGAGGGLTLTSPNNRVRLG